jgi:glycine/D-amino acid oxidase-like deaminating enzyme
MGSGSTGRDLRFVVIGAGMSGILAAIKLREAGFGDVVIHVRDAGTTRPRPFAHPAGSVPERRRHGTPISYA